MKKRIFIDTETTGLDAQKHAIIELAFIIEIDGKVVEEESLTMCPAKGKLVNKEALEVNGIEFGDIKNFTPQHIVYEKFLEVLDKYINKYDTNDKFYCYAYNATFDQNFINQWFLDNKNEYMFSYTHWPWISVDVLAAIYAEGQRYKFEDFKLGTVAKSLGVELNEESLHSGIYDVEIMMEIYARLEKEFNV